MPTVVVVGAQWGDEGKGKVTDYLSAEADTVVRYQGGHNTGATVVVGDREYRLHLVPAGIIHGKKCVVGNGVALDPWAFVEERTQLAAQGLNVDRIYISDTAHVILPFHRLMDAAEEERRVGGKIGTTLRGVGPAYQDKAARIGIRVGDLVRPASLRARLAANLVHTNALLTTYGIAPAETEVLARELEQIAPQIAPHISDTATLINDAIDAGERVLFEGAQGTLLDIDHGTYPFVTSSHPTAGGACIGSGVGPSRIDRVVGVSKAYSTRVGDGPFPTELGDATGERLLRQGREFGTTTGRPRRCGWLDAVALRYAVQINGLSGVCITKLDTLTGISPLRIATAYQLDGSDLLRMPHDVESLARCVPIYEEIEGWDEDISGVRSPQDLPPNAQEYLRRLQALVGVPVLLVSVGAERAETMALRSVFSM